MTVRNAVTTASIAGVLLLCPAVPSAAPSSVPGEKLDSGLGDLSASYTAAEFQQPATTAFHVPGEKLDSGLGELPASYTAAEFQPGPAGNLVLGKK
jgi:hypothetical protein